MNEISQVFKVVQVVDGRWFSVNRNDWSIKDGPKALAAKNVLEYKYMHQTLPLPHLKKIFVCANLADAQKALRFYHDGNNDKAILILKGFGANKVVVLDHEVIYKNKNNPNGIGRVSIPRAIPTALVDWFVPTSIVATT